MPRGVKEETKEKLQEMKTYLDEGLSDTEICAQLNISRQVYTRWIKQYKFEFGLHRLLPEKFKNDKDIKELAKNTSLPEEVIQLIFHHLNNYLQDETSQKVEFPDLSARQRYFLALYFQKRLHLSEIKACVLIGQNLHIHRKMPREIEQERRKAEYNEALKTAIQSILDDSKFQAYSRFKNLEALDQLSYRRMAQLLRKKGFKCDEQMIQNLWKAGDSNTKR